MRNAQNLDSDKRLNRVFAFSICVLLIFTIPFCANSNAKNVSENKTNDFSKIKYDGVYSDLKFIGDGYRYTSFQGKFKNLTGRRLSKLGVQVSFFEGKSKLQILNTSIEELGPNEDWKFVINYVDKNATTVRIDKINEYISGIGKSDLVVISEESFIQEKNKIIERENYKKPTEEELAAQHKEWERQTAIQKVESSLKENQTKIKNQKLLEAKYRGVRLRAESGSVEAMFELSNMLRNGIGCNTNIEESIQWLNKFQKQKQTQSK